VTGKKSSNAKESHKNRADGKKKLNHVNRVYCWDWPKRAKVWGPSRFATVRVRQSRPGAAASNALLLSLKENKNVDYGEGRAEIVRKGGSDAGQRPLHLPVSGHLVRQKG